MFVELNSVKEKLDEVTLSNENLKEVYEEQISKSKKFEVGILSGKLKISADLFGYLFCFFVENEERYHK